MGDLRESLQRRAEYYDRFDADNVSDWLQFVNDRAPTAVRVYTGKTDQGRDQVFLVAVPEDATDSELEEMLETGSGHPGVMELSHPCPPYCT